MATPGSGAADRITIIIPVYNEEAVLDRLVAEISAKLEGADFDWTVLFVDDGSTDATLARIRQVNAADRRFTALSFSRNFGKEIAMAAGLRHATGDAAVIMDADLQHPPELIHTFVRHWRDGHKVVYGARVTRLHDSWLRRAYSRLFHGLFGRIAGTVVPEGMVDFLLFDRAAVAVLNRLGERTRFSKGLFAWIGFKSVAVPFDYGERSAGGSRWSFIKLASFAVDGFVSFSSLPLKVWSYVGAGVSLFAILSAVYFVIRTLLFEADVPGFPSLIVSIMFFSGVQLVSLGVIGEYLARIYEEVKARPLFVVEEEVGLESEEVGLESEGRPPVP